MVIMEQLNRNSFGSVNGSTDLEKLSQKYLIKLYKLFRKEYEINYHNE